MKVTRIITASVVLVVLGICGYAWQRYILHPKPTACGYYLRPLQATLRVTAEIVHDYPTGNALAHEKAWFVEESRAQACEHDAMHMNEMKETQDLAFDRCSPGTFAFANRVNAEAFIAQNGGLILSFQEFMGEVRTQ